MMNYGGVLALLIAAALKATNVLGWRTAIAYFFLSVALEYAIGVKNVPQMLVVYTSLSFAAYIIIGVLRHRIDCTRKQQKSFAINLSITSALFVFLLGYLFTLLSVDQNTAFIITIASYFAVGLRQLQRHSSTIKAALLLSIAHAIIFSGGKMLIIPAYNVVAYIIITILLSEIRAAFSIAYTPKELREGMMLAESIEHDGEKYIFGTQPYPSIISILRYVTGGTHRKRRTVASVFTTLKSHHIAELTQVAKIHNKKTFLVQKKIDMSPFIFLGAIMMYLIKTYAN